LRSGLIALLSLGLALVVLTVGFAAIPARAGAAVPSGSLSQLPSSNCVSEEEAGGTLACTTLVHSGLSSTYEVQVSPEDNNAYSVAINGALVEYSRSQATGALKVIGCVTSETTSCAPKNETKEVATMSKPAAIAISPDGKSVYVVTQGNNNLVELSRDPETGLLTEIGCISHESTSTCAAKEAKGLDIPYGVTVSPDGENVYVASYGDEAIVELSRNTTTGELTQLAEPNNCISSTSASGCGVTNAVGLERAVGVVVSPGGEDVYVAAGGETGQGAIASFKRGVGGALTQLPTTEACISETNASCLFGAAIDGPEDLVVSPDGKNVYANSYKDNAVIELTRNVSTGGLTQNQTPNACVTTEAITGQTARCSSAKGIEGALGVAISPEGNNVYASGSFADGEAAFARESTEGELKQLESPYECVTSKPSGCGSGSNELTGLGEARRVTVSPDGTNVYLAGQSSHAIAELTRTVEPKVATISPQTGSEAGSTEVTIEGSGFAEGASVEFGTKPALNVKVNTATSITATSPAGSGSNLNVTVTNTAGASPDVAADEFTYTTPAKPTIGEIAPTYGNELGDTKVTIIGTEFLAGSQVHFGASPAESVTVNSGQSITATSPPGVGTVNVTVSTPYGASATTKGDEFKYVYVPPDELGGMNIAGYCESIGDEGNGGGASTYLKGEVNGPEYAYNNWACVEDDGHAVEIATTGPAPSMENLCTSQYDVASYGYASEPNTAFSWNCYEDAPAGESKDGGGRDEVLPPLVKLASGEVFTPLPIIVPPPVLAKTGNVAPVKGVVLVELPGTKGFVPLASLTQIPFGTVIEATNGTVSVTTANPNGTTQTGQFFDGQFILTQGKNGQVSARLSGGNFSVCPTARERAHRARVSSYGPVARTAASGKHVVRKLWANAHGKFSTEGNYAAGAVQGTEWLTEDLCEGTLIRVTRDKVAVTNLVNHKHVEVKTGHKYLAKAP
jgi:DNA-binding beta-propeller fold protein YncE